MQKIGSVRPGNCAAAWLVAIWSTRHGVCAALCLGVGSLCISVRSHTHALSQRGKHKSLPAQVAAVSGRKFVWMLPHCNSSWIYRPGAQRPLSNNPTLSISHARRAGKDYPTLNLCIFTRRMMSEDP